MTGVRLCCSASPRRRQPQVASRCGSGYLMHRPIRGRSSALPPQHQPQGRSSPGRPSACEASVNVNVCAAVATRTLCICRTRRTRQPRQPHVNTPAAPAPLAGTPRLLRPRYATAIVVCLLVDDSQRCNAANRACVPGKLDRDSPPLFPARPSTSTSLPTAPRQHPPGTAPVLISSPYRRPPFHPPMRRQ